MLRRLLSLAVGASMAVSAWAHGYMSVPVSRNVGSGTYCDHCLSGGGLGVVYANGRRWPNGNYGVCGDPPSGEGEGYHLGGGKFEQTVGIRVTSYHAGDAITVKTKVTANHWGFFSFFLCKLPDSSFGGKGESRVLTNECFSRIKLRALQDGTWGERFYIGSRTGDIELSVRLPDMECKRCVMRWLYTTGNSCTAPGTPAKWATSNLRPCGADGANPEEFLNCADVALVRKGQALPAVSRVTATEGLGTASGESSGESEAVPGRAGARGEDVILPAAGSNKFPIGVGEVACSAMAGAALGTPLLIVNPLLGLAVGFFACMALLAFFALGGKLGNT